MANKHQDEMEQETVFIDGDLPASGEGRQGVWKRRLEPLMTDEGTGRWAQVFVTSPNQARTYAWALAKGLKATLGLRDEEGNKIEGGLKPPTPAAGYTFLFTSRIVDGEGVVYAKYAEVEAEAEVEEADTEEAEAEEAAEVE